MWKSAFISICFLFTIIEAIPAPGRGALKDFCNSDYHCDSKSKCCASFNTPRGQHAAEKLKNRGFSIGIVKGYCERRGQQDSQCLQY